MEPRLSLWSPWKHHIELASIGTVQNSLGFFKSCSSGQSICYVTLIITEMSPLALIACVVCEQIFCPSILSSTDITYLEMVGIDCQTSDDKRPYLTSEIAEAFLV